MRVQFSTGESQHMTRCGPCGGLSPAEPLPALAGLCLWHGAFHPFGARHELPLTRAFRGDRAPAVRGALAAGRERLVAHQPALHLPLGVLMFGLSLLALGGVTRLPERAAAQEVATGSRAAR